MSKEKSKSKYGVAELGKELGILPQSVRVQLRNHKVKKNAAGTYGWDSQTEFKAVAAKLRSNGSGKSPAKKTAAKAPAKKVAAKTSRKAKATAAAASA